LSREGGARFADLPISSTLRRNGSSGEAIQRQVGSIAVITVSKLLSRARRRRQASRRLPSSAMPELGLKLFVVLRRYDHLRAILAVIRERTRRDFDVT